MATAGLLVAVAAHGQRQDEQEQPLRDVQQQLWYEQHGDLSQPQNRDGRRRFDPRRSYREITFGMGLYMPIQGETGDDELCYRISYMQYNPGGFGFGGGLRYIPCLRGVPDCFEIPLTVAWRTPLPRRFAKRDPVGTVMDAWGNSVEQQQKARYYGTEYDDGGWWFASALLMLLPSRVEFMGGISPGWIAGRDGTYLESIGGSSWYETGLVRRRSFTTTLDVGLKLSYRIWRFTLSATPEYHFRVTNNFRKVQESCLSIGRGYFSLTGNLGVMF